MKYCMEYAALLDLYVDGELSQEEMAQVQAHLADCPGCQVYVDDALLIRAEFPDVESVKVPEGFTEDVMKRIQADSKAEGNGQKKRRRWLSRLVPLAACCALAVFLYDGPIYSGQSDGGADAGVDSSGDIYAATGSDLDTGESSVWSGARTAETEEANAMEQGGVFAQSDTVEDRSASYESGKESAAAPMAAEPQEAPGAPEAIIEDAAEKKVMLTLRAEKVGSLMDGWILAEEGDNVRWYSLTAEQYQELLEAMEIDSVYSADAADELMEEGILIEITGPF